MGSSRVIDLSVPIQQTPAGSMLGVEIEYIDHKEGASVFGPVFGLKEDDFPDGNFSAVEKVSLTTHSGTHLDAPWHYGPTSEGKPARTIDDIPLEWCFGDGVRLDLTHKNAGEEIDVGDLQDALDRIGYTLKPRDIVLVMTGVSDVHYGRSSYVDAHPGVTRAATLWLIEKGIRVMGIDAWGWDKPFKVMVEEVRAGHKEKLWAAHFAGKEKEYCHIENLTGLAEIPRPFGFKLSVLPVKIDGAGGGWVRAAAIIDD